jgi:hypothetical protein
MLNWSLGLGGILGIALALAGVGLYFLRTVRPNLAREHDIFFAAVALLCGGILLFQSWRLDPILQFAQFLSIGSAIWFAYEAIRLRGITTEQAKRSTPMVDDERPVSRVYRAELDELTPLDEQRTVTRRIRGSRDGREDDYGEGRRRDRNGDGRNGDERYGDERYGNDRSNNQYGDSYGDDRSRRNARPLPPERNSWDDRPNRSSESGAGMRESIRDSSFSPRTRNTSDRPTPSSRRRGGDADYVDFQPIDLPEDGPNRPRDNW